MVNTRRMESSGLATGNGPRYRTRKTDVNLPEIGSSCESDSGQEEEDETLEDPGNEWDVQDKDKTIIAETPAPAAPPQPSLVPRVRELRNRFVCDERKFSQLRSLRSRELRSGHKHRSVSDRRHLTVFTNHKMHDDLDSEEDCYSPRHYSRRNRYSKSHLDRIERRTALSLRPITIKSYKDLSPGTCNSDDSDFIKVRRSMRNRSSGDKSMSWLTDDQMHKVGYPNLRRKRYSDDDDSRDAQSHHTMANSRESHKRMTRHSHDTLKKNPKYLYSYDTEDIHKICADGIEVCKPERILEKNLRSTSRTESHDKENKEENIYNGRNSGRLRKSKDGPEDDKALENDKQENAGVKEEEIIAENNTEENGDLADEEEEGVDETHLKPSVEASTESDDNTPLQRRTRRARQVESNGYSKRTRNRKMSDSSSSSEAGIKPYSLRDRAPKQKPVNLCDRSSRSKNMEREPMHPRRRFNRRKLSSSSSSNSSDSDIDRRKNSKYSKNAKNQHSKNEQLKSGAGGSKVIPIGPETLDPKITFNCVGGLDAHVQCLKEMILLPMMYPEVFRRFQIQPPRGVLFHGPPGTGKTLIARALANECSFGSRKVSFFMRKGADLLSKWIGESEKQLRLLFEQAAEMKPSIIFFDELDGLAPVRSSRQDQIHASIVSTLLALMDGLDNRGEVIVIGATNRVDAIDPALRRPGRFDRELFFPLPAQKEREEILKVHVAQWTTPPNEQLISYLAENSVGYCGSDLRALCSEAVIQSFRRTYPQVYTADHRLLLNPENVKVEKLDFLRAKSMLLPASHRISQSISRKLSPVLDPLLRQPLDDILNVLGKSFPHGTNPSLAKVKLSAAMRPAQMLLIGEGFYHGHTSYLAPAILHRMEHINAHMLDLAALFRDCGRSPEEVCFKVFHEAKRNVPSIIYIPNIDILWKLVSNTVLAIFTSQILQIGPNTPILILATADCLEDELPEQISSIFSKYRNEIYEMSLPNAEARENFFKLLLIDASLKPPRTSRVRTKTPPPLERAPTPPATPITQEAAQKLFEQEERTLRELRIFLRDMCKKLASNRLFYMFIKPVDTEEVPDYPTIIKQPMDLETMMTKVDFHRYECAKDFLEDIELICQNALEYNPARTSADKQIRHRACSLRDYAFALIKNEMDSDFEDKCKEISSRRKQRKASINQFLPPYLDTPTNANKAALDTPVKVDETKQTCLNISQRVSPSRKRKVPSWQRGYLKKRKRKDRTVLTESLHEDLNEEKLSSGDESKENNPEVLAEKMPLESNEECDISDKTPTTDGSIKSTAPLSVNCDTTTSTNVKSDNLSTLQSPQTKRRLSDLLSPSELLDDPLDFDDIDQALNEVSESSSEKPEIDICEEELKNVLQNAVAVTEEQSLHSLLDLHYQLSRIIKKYIRICNRKTLPKELLHELTRYQKENKNAF